MHASVTRLRAIAFPCLRAMVPAAILLSAPAAFAQKAGHYQGTNAEGYTVDVYVSGSTGDFTVTGTDEDATTFCKKTAAGVWGIAIGTSLPITDGEATLTLFDVSTYYNSVFHFSGDKVTGKTTFTVPAFFGSTEPPKLACAQATKNEKFSATLVGAETRAPAQTWVRVLRVRPQ